MTKQTFEVGNKLIYGKGDWYKEGTVVTVLDVDAKDISMPYYVTDGNEEYWIEGNDLKLKPTKNQRISALEKEVAALKDEVAALKKAQGKTVTSTISVEPGADFAKLAEELSKSLAKRKSLLTPNQKASANSLRKAIIDEAKVFVEDGAKVDLSLGRGRGYVKNSVICNVDFVVNAEKRTVVAILRWRYNGNIEAKGIAKCAPNDVFNEHIGKAIALGRALGLDVSKFENAVKPTEVVIGMKVRGNISGQIFEVSAFHKEEKLGGHWGRSIATNGVDSPMWVGAKQVTIIDDTEAQYE